MPLKTWGRLRKQLSASSHCAATRRAAEAGERVHRSDAGPGRAAPAADTGWDELDNAVIMQPLPVVVIFLLFLQRWAAELTAQLCQAQHMPWRRKGREQSKSFPLGRRGAGTEDTHLSRLLHLHPCSPRRRQFSNRKTCLVPSEQS